MHKPFVSRDGVRTDLNYHYFIDGTCIWCRQSEREQRCPDCGNAWARHACTGGPPREGMLPCPPRANGFTPAWDRKEPDMPWDLMGL